MNQENIMELTKLLSSTSFHICLTITLVSLIKTFLTLFFSVRLSEVNKSTISIRTNEKSASYSKPEQSDRIIRILKSDDDVVNEFYNKSS